MWFRRTRREAYGFPPEPKTTGQKVCIGLVLLLMVSGAAALILSCCPTRRRIPRVPPLPSAPPAVSMPGKVRVLLVRGTKATAACPDGGTWHAGPPGQNPVLASGKGPWDVGLGDGRVMLGGEPLGPQAFLYPNDGRFSLNGTTYRGRLTASVSGDALTFYNELPPGQYLRSVVGSEMYAGWPLDAQMAQAVAARTYMLYTQRDKGYLSLIDMAYKGVEAESRYPDLAVELTRGIVITYNGRLFPAYFHSTCGGHTVAVDKVFDDLLIAPLSGVPCEWCRQSPAYEWQVQLPAAQIARALADRGVQRVRSLVPLGTEPEGYAREILVNGTLQMDANAFRLAVGGNKLKSTRFSVTARGDDFVFEGRGYGHGVGLCQWGAWGLAREGHDWQHILTYYYPGVDIEQAD